MSEQKGNGHAHFRTPQRKLKEQIECQSKERKVTRSKGSNQLANLQAIYNSALSLFEEKQELKELALAKFQALQAEHDFKVALANVRMSRQAVNAGTIYEINITNSSGNPLQFAICSAQPVFSNSQDQVIVNAIWSGYIQPDGVDTWSTNIQYFACVQTRNHDAMPQPGDSNNAQAIWKPVDLQSSADQSTMSSTNLILDHRSIGLSKPVHGDATLQDGSFRITTPTNYINKSSLMKKSLSFEPLSVLIAVTGLTAAAIYRIIKAQTITLNGDLSTWKFDITLENPPPPPPADDEFDDEFTGSIPVDISPESGFSLTLDQVCSKIFAALQKENTFPGRAFTVKPGKQYGLVNRFSAVFDPPTPDVAYFNVGLGLANTDPSYPLPVVMAGYVNGPPGLHIDITPVAKYYVMISEATVGEVINTKIWSASALIDFTTSNGKLTAMVTYEPNGTWSTPTFI